MNTIEKKITFAVLMLAISLVSGCKKNNKAKTIDNIALENQHNTRSADFELQENSSRIFDEDIEAFVLEDESLNPFEPSHAQTSLASNENFHFVLDEVEPLKDHKHVVFFEYDSSKIKPDQEAVLAADINAKQALVQKGQKINCVGHACKWHGTKAYNIALSEQRAQQIAKKYEQAGIPKSHIKVFGIGSEDPIAFESSKVGQAPNRRVEVYVTA